MKRNSKLRRLQSIISECKALKAEISAMRAKIVAEKRDPLHPTPAEDKRIDVIIARLEQLNRQQKQLTE